MHFHSQYLLLKIHILGLRLRLLRGGTAAPRLLSFPRSSNGLQHGRSPRAAKGLQSKEELQEIQIREVDFHGNPVIL